MIELLDSFLKVDKLLNKETKKPSNESSYFNNTVKPMFLIIRQKYQSFQ